MTDKKLYLVFQHHWDGLDFCGVYDNFDAAQSLASALHRAHSAVTEVHEVGLQGKHDIDITRRVSQGLAVWSSMDEFGAI